MAAEYGEEAASELRERVIRQVTARKRTEQRQVEARAISAAREARGEGEELDADRQPLRPLHEHGRSKRKQGRRRDRKIRSTFERRAGRDHTRELAQAEAMAEKALQSHGIHHHYRPLAKTAFFVAYMAAQDRNGILVRQALRSINMPRERQDQVLAAAYGPTGYTPTRNTSRGKREAERRHTYDGRPFGRRTVKEGEIDRPGWEDGTRASGHPGAIRVLVCAIFLWLVKGNTRRPGYAHSVRGFGRGVFTAICGCAKDALFGHEAGLPGALVALRASGFIEYRQPPAEKCAPVDRGPSGHAYNVYWFRSSVAEQQVEAFRARLASLPSLPQVAAWLANPLSIAQRANAPPQPASTSPPFSEADIPY